MNFSASALTASGHRTQALSVSAHGTRVLESARELCAKGHRALNLSIALAIPVQFYLAGIVLFGVAGFGPHRVAGFLLLVLGLLSLLLAGIAGRSRSEPALAAILFGLLVLQPVFVTLLRRPLPAVAALHVVNGLAILGVAIVIERRCRSSSRTHRLTGSADGARSPTG